MNRAIQRLAGAAVALLLIFSASVGARAQGSVGPAVVVFVYDPDGKGAVARRYEAGNPTGKDFLQIAERLDASVSPDAQWFVTFGSIGDAGNFGATYGKIGSPGTSLPIDPGYSYIGGSFSPDNKYLSYTLAKSPQDPKEQLIWIFNILELETGKIATFKGPFVYPTDSAGQPNPLPPLGMYGGPITSGWIDSTHPVVNAFIPFTTGILGAVYSIDLTKAADGKLPPATALLKQNLPALAVQSFSPDMKKLAFASNDPSRAVPNYVGAFDPLNTINVVDLASGQTTTIQMPSNQGVGSVLIWTPDSAKVLFTAGPYVPLGGNTGGSVMSMPTLNTIDAATGTVTPGPVLLSDADSSINEMLACGSTLYFTVVKNTGTGSATTIVTAPISDPNAQTELAKLATYASLKGCTP